MNTDTGYGQYPQQYPPQASQPPTVRKRHRVFWWIFATIQVIFILWLVTGAAAAGHTSCTGDLSAHDCASAQDVGNTIGIALILVFWCVVDFLVGVPYVIYRLARRPAR
jgi:hypothetical protein